MSGDAAQPPGEDLTAQWTGPQWGAYYASIALELGNTTEAAAILHAVLRGSWDGHTED